MIGIYKITNKLDDKIYIGQSNDIERRWNEHKRKYKNGDTLLYSAMQKDGIDNFIFEIIELCELNELNEKEKYWINHYNTINNGYNMSTIDNCTHKLNINEVKEIQKEIKENTYSYQYLSDKYNISHTWLSLVNKGKLWYDKELNYPLRPIIEKHSNFCIDCGKKIEGRSTRCNTCQSIINRICERPSREELKALIRKDTFVNIGKKYNVSDNAVRKWCIFYNLPNTKKKIKSYTDEQWLIV